MSKKDDNIIPLPTSSKNSAVEELKTQFEEIKNSNQDVSKMATEKILEALKHKDSYTYGHCARVAFFSLKLGEELNLEASEMYKLELAALFHDIGKIGIPDAVLNKPTRLEEDEFLIMKTHPELSEEILSEFKIFGESAKYARHHHERYDGRGYPDGLSAENIPLFSRIILIADTFDAMTSTRPYRKGKPYKTAFNELMEFSGTQFDPNLVVHFISAMEKESKKKGDYFQLNIIKEKFKKDAA